MAKAALEPQGRYEELRADMTRACTRGFNEADGRHASAPPAEYLVTRRPHSRR